MKPESLLSYPSLPSAGQISSPVDFPVSSVAASVLLDLALLDIACDDDGSFGEEDFGRQAGQEDAFQCQSSSSSRCCSCCTAVAGLGCSCSCIGYLVVILDRSPLHLYSLEVVPKCSLKYPRRLNFENTMVGVKTIFVQKCIILLT